MPSWTKIQILSIVLRKIRVLTIICNYNPQFLQLHLDPASSNVLPASGNGSITQKLRVINSQHGKVRTLVGIYMNHLLNKPI